MKLPALFSHIGFYSLFFGLFVIAIATNNGSLGAFYGGVIGALTDPLLWIGGAVLGAAVLRQRYLIPALLCFAVIASYWISETNAEWLGISKFNLELIFIRFIAVLFVGFLFNGARILISKKSRIVDATP